MSSKKAPGALHGAQRSWIMCTRNKKEIRPVYKEIGAVFQRIREERGLSLEEVAGMIGYPKGGDASGLQRMEKGEKRVFMDLYWQVALALGVPLHRIIQEAESPAQVSEKVYSPQETVTVNRYLAMSPESKAHMDYFVAAVANSQGKPDCDK